MGTYEQLGVKGTPAETMKVCGQADLNTHTILLFTGDQVSDLCRIRFENLSDNERNRQSWVQTLAHELGHTFRLADAEDSSACRNPNGPGSIMGGAYGARKAVTTDDCNALEKEVKRFCEQNPDDDRCDDGGGGGNPDIDCAGTDAGGCRPGRGDDDDDTDACAFPKPGCPGYCDLNPFHRDCPPDCTLFPGDPRCGDVTVDVCWGKFEDTDGDGELECVPREYLRVGGDGKNPVVITAASASSRSYRIRLDHPGKLGVKLTGMNRDFDCKLYASPKPPSGDAPDAATGSTRTSRCTNRGGTRDDSLEKSLPAGSHRLSVYPFTGGTGDYTLTLSYAADPLPSPIARILPSHDTEAEEGDDADEDEEDGDDEGDDDGEDEDSDTEDGDTHRVAREHADPQPHVDRGVLHHLDHGLPDADAELFPARVAVHVRWKSESFEQLRPVSPVMASHDASGHASAVSRSRP